MKIIWCMVPEMWSTKILLWFWIIFCHFTPLTTRKINISKHEKNTWRYYHFTHVYHRWQNYNVQSLSGYGGQQSHCHFGSFIDHRQSYDVWFLKWIGHYSVYCFDACLEAFIGSGKNNLPILLRFFPPTLSCYNPGQGIWSGMGRSSKTGRGKKSLISTFACFSAENVSTQIWDFPNISLFPKILSLMSFGSLWGNSYTKFAILDITFRFACG